MKLLMVTPPQVRRYYNLYSSFFGADTPSAHAIKTSRLFNNLERGETQKFHNYIFHPVRHRYQNL